MTTIIVTVGTSLIGNFIRQKIDFSQCEEELFQQMMTADKIETFSAEISSTHSLLKQYPNPDALHLIVSDTAEGTKIGALLKRYFQTIIPSVTVHVIDGLNGQAPELFQQQGLRNLVRVLLTILRAYPNSIVNATGGYKAQVAFAGLVGQLFRVRVFYQFEGFQDVIALPAMQLLLNTELFYTYEETFQQLANNTLTEIPLELTEYIDNYNGNMQLTAIGYCLCEYVNLQREGDV